jgi:glycosyltransferase involved in cell wall biosynthesis
MARILMVSPYPPIRDGIGTYAAQEVRGLLLEGHDVEVLSPQPSAAHHHLRLRGPRGPAALARRVAGYDRVIVQYHPDVFYPHPASVPERLAVTSALLGACVRAHNVEFRIHEFKAEWGTGVHGQLLRRLWSAARRVEVHTETERTSFAEAFGLRPDRVEVVDHGTHFAARVDPGDRAAIRAALGIGADEYSFVAIGFIQPHKGFDRAVRAFARLGLAGARLDVVGSVRVEDDLYVDYVDELRDLVEATPGTALHEGFVSDERFDQWLVAADCLVLPYRTIWSSGVLERARLYGTPVIATRVGGLEAQAAEGATLVADDAELVYAMAAAVEGPRAAVEPGGPWAPIAGKLPVDREVVQAELRARASRNKPAPGPAPTARRAAGGRRFRGAGLRALEPFALPAPESGRSSGRAAKRLVHRLTYWQLAPLVQLQAEVSAWLRKE